VLAIILGKDDSIKWDGTLYSYPDWNHDQTLASAFKVSCVWCFQKLAKRVGVDKYHQYLAAINYGELQNPFEVTTFWLDNSLKISPTEQIDFLRKLYQRTLPFNAHSYDTLREIMQVEAASNFKLFAKTGAGGKYNPHMGWYVGYVETEKDVWLFATNLEIRDEKDLPLRHKITKDALITKGIIE
jgi:beta-lactamase class D